MTLASEDGQKRHRWNADNHTRTETYCLDCGLRRKAAVVREKGKPKGTPGVGVTKYLVDRQWRRLRVPPCLGMTGRELGSVSPIADDVATLDQWVFKYPGCSHRTTAGKVVLALPNGFSKQFVGPNTSAARHSAAEHIRRILKKKAAAE